MKTKFFFLCLASSLLSLSGGCGSGSWTDRPFDVAAEATLTQFLQDIAALSGVSVSVDPELQAALDLNPVDLPTLSGTTAGEALTLVQDMMPPETAYVYEELEDGSLLLRFRFEEVEDLSGTDPMTIVEFDEGLGLTASALISDPAFDEECGGGTGLFFAIVTEVVSDPGGHSEFIGPFPPEVQVGIVGNEIAVSGASPWVNVAGTIDAEGSFTSSGSGVVAGFPDVTVTFNGQATASGISGILTVGAGGELPGGDAAVYAVNP